MNDSSPVFDWEFSDKQENVKSSEEKSECLIGKDYFTQYKKERVTGAKPYVLGYNINLVEGKDTMLHFHYYNISEQEKPIAERHANYHLQIELKFKYTKNNCLSTNERRGLDHRSFIRIFN